MTLDSYHLPMPARPPRPRTAGLSIITDKGTPLGLLRDTLESYGEFLDIAKLGIGAGFIEPRLKEKVGLYAEFRVPVYFGGTLFEKFFHAGLLDEYRRLMSEAGIRMLEVSEGSLPIPLAERCRLVTEFARDYTVLAEVGTKDSDAESTPQTWIAEIRALLDAGSAYVITEGRDSGSAGIFTKTGELRKDLIEAIASAVPTSRLIFEAPTERSQMYFINRIGPDVNLGNVAVHGLLVLEAQRRGLRYETFQLGQRA